MKKHTPTREQLDALANFAANEGRSWKAALRHAWETGDYPTGSQSAELQQVRNNFGPGWLIGFKVRPVGSKYTASDMGTAPAVIADIEGESRTRIGNTPSCDLCGGQHGEDHDCQNHDGGDDRPCSPDCEACKDTRPESERVWSPAPITAGPRGNPVYVDRITDGDGITRTLSVPVRLL